MSLVEVIESLHNIPCGVRGELNAIEDFVERYCMIPKVHWLSLYLGPIIDISQSVDVGLFVNLLDLSNFLGLVGSRVNFEYSLAHPSSVCVENRCDTFIKVLVSTQEEVTALNRIEDA